MSISKISEIINKTYILLQNYNEQNSCIISTAVLIKTINRVFPKLEIYPLCVEAKVFDPKQSKQLESNQQVTGTIRVIGHPDTPSTEHGWSGHLVGIMPNIENKTFIVDLSIVQASSEKDKILLLPIMSNIRNEFQEKGKHMVKINGCYICYTPYQNNKSYEDEELWNDRKYIEEISGCISLDIQ